MTVVQAYIDSWNGRHQEARVIADALSKECFVTVVHTEPDEHSWPQRGPARWLAVPDDHYFGLKLKRALDEFSGDVFMHVMTDVTCEDWPALVRRCRQVFEQIPELGIWTPQVTGRESPWDFAKTTLHAWPEMGLYLTTQTDQLVWAMHRDVANRMRQLDFSKTNLGWGCDLAAATYCHTHHRLVAQDMNVAIFHDHGTRYSWDKAGEEMWAFLAQLSMPEKMSYEMVRRSFRL